MELFLCHALSTHSSQGERRKALPLIHLDDTKPSSIQGMRLGAIVWAFQLEANPRGCFGDLAVVNYSKVPKAA